MNKTIRVLLVVGVFTMGFVWGVAFEQKYAVRPLQAKLDGCKSEMEITKAIELARTNQPGATFDFGEFRGQPIQLVVEDNGRIVLQILYGSLDVLSPEDGATDHLKKQVEAAVGAKDGIKLRNGMTLRVEGYPIWGPHSSIGPHGGARRLMFGERVTFNGKMIVVHGEAKKPVGYYPYSL